MADRHPDPHHHPALSFQRSLTRSPRQNAPPPRELKVSLRVRLWGTHDLWGRILRATLFFWLIDITVPAIIILYLFDLI
jgi:hypothetical protein